MTFALKHVCEESDGRAKEGLVLGGERAVAMSLEVEEVLNLDKSKFQDILIFQRSSRAASYSSW